MTLRFSALPGRQERHLQRLHHNPLFGAVAATVSQQQLETARAQDEAEAQSFEKAFISLIEEVTALPPNEDSERILEIKMQLDKSYEQASGLRGEQTKIKQAIVKLLAAIMRAVRRGAQGDAQACQTLDHEDAARDLHYHLLQYPLVADLLAADSPIDAEHLLPTLLSAGADALAAALKLFNPAQLGSILADGRALLKTLDSEMAEAATARLRLLQIEQYLTQQNSPGRIN